LSFIVAPDFEAPTDAGGNNVYDVIVQVSDNQGSTDTQAIAVTVTSVNDSTPVITSGNTASVAENTTAVMTVTATDADQPAQTLTYSIVGGADAAHFQINASTGALSFIVAPDFEAPTDAGGNNVYDVIVQVSDNQGSTDTQAIAVTVYSANDSPPLITSNSTASVAENTTAVMTVTATDADQPAQTLSFSIVGGADAAHFAIDAASGVLRFVAQPDFERPADAGRNNIYEVIVQVSDGILNTTQSLTVHVTGINEAPQGSNGSIVLDEDDSHTFSVGDFGFSDPNDNNANRLAAVQIVSLPSRGVLSLNGQGVAAGQWIAAADIAAGLLRYAPPADENGMAFASLGFRVRDDGGTANGGVDTEAGSHSLSINVTPVSDTPVGVEDAYTVDEDNTLQVGEGGVLTNDTDPDGMRLSAELVEGPANGRLELAADGSFRYTPNADWNGIDSFSYRPTNGQEIGEAVQVRLTVTPVNDAPSLIKASFQVNSGGNVTLAGDAVRATDVDSAQGDLRYTVIRTEHGHFELSTAPGQPASGFSQADLLAGRVVFRHDAFADKPVVVLQVNDGQTDGNELTATIGFTPAGSITTGDLPTAAPLPGPVLSTPTTPAPAATTLPKPASPGLGSTPLTLMDNPADGEGGNGLQRNDAADGTGPNRRYPLASLVRFTQAQITLTLGASPDGALMEFMLSGQDPASGSSSAGSRGDADRTKQVPLAEPYADVQMALRAVELSGIVLSVGAVWWATRAGGLVASLLMVAPAWRTFDPLPVLGPEDEDERDWGRQMDDEMTRDEIGAADLFDQEREGLA
ncbi:MAG: cadherin-like domain-containing protein, partial [Zoogloea sp.]|uniref:Ig-like domain-containing protein n=1 Tax=Zoogloea sp. TaxID=49181 RepID=UPI0026271CED